MLYGYIALFIGFMFGLYCGNSKFRNGLNHFIVRVVVFFLNLTLMRNHKIVVDFKKETKQEPVKANSHRIEQKAEKERDKDIDELVETQALWEAVNKAPNDMLIKALSKRGQVSSRN